MSERTFFRWVEMPENEPVKFGELLRLMVEALHSDAFAQAAAQGNLEAELQAMVDAGELMVRDPLTLGRHPFPIGDGLRRAVLLPGDVRPLLESRGIGLRLIPFGTGPTHWTIENAAAAIAAQEGWHNGARDTLRDHMLQAAHEGTLPVRHPHTGKVFRPDTVRAFYELVTPADVGAWFALDPIAGLERNPTVPAIAELVRPAVKANLDVDTAPASPTRPLTSPQLANAFDGAAERAAIAEPVPAGVVAERTTHAQTRRAAPLAAVIKLAKNLALDSTDWLSVWAMLVNLAQRDDRPPPLLGYTEGEGVKYQTDNAATPVAWLTREGFRKRFGRRR